MSQQLKHSLRCKILAVLRAGPRDACQCSELARVPVETASQLLVEMEVEGLVSPALGTVMFWIARVPA